jgi:DNA polymerase III alpha subunit
METTTALGEACVVDLAELRPELPGFPVSHGHTEVSSLRHLAQQGVEFGQEHAPDDADAEGDRHHGPVKARAVVPGREMGQPRIAVVSRVNWRWPISL